MPETLLTIEEVAKQLQVSTRTVRRMTAERNEIKSFMVGKRLRFTQSEIDAYIKRQQEAERKEG